MNKTQLLQELSKNTTEEYNTTYVKMTELENKYVGDVLAVWLDQNQNQRDTAKYKHVESCLEKI